MVGLRDQTECVCVCVSAEAGGIEQKHSHLVCQ